jgi:cytochrome c
MCDRYFLARAFSGAGRRAEGGTDTGFPHIRPNAGLTWDEATLDRYLASPRNVVAHTIMTYGGLKGAHRANLTACLAILP